MTSAADNSSSLTSAGYAYLVGDAALFASGMLSGRYKEASSGLLYATGGLALARYGKPDAEQRLKSLNHKVAEHFTEQGITLPQGTGLHSAELAKKGGVIEKIEDFLYTYPTETMNAIFAIGGAQMVRSGMAHNKKWDAASGALIVAGGLTGLLVPEKAPAATAESAPKDMLTRAKDWVQESPLRASGYLYTLNNIPLAYSALKERSANPGQKSYLFKLLTAASYMVANFALSKSSKSGGGDEASQQLLAHRAAEVIAAQAPEVQHALIQNTAIALASQKGLNGTAEEFAEMMKQKISETAQFKPHGWQQLVVGHTSFLPLTR